jgi:Icc-related predicted phosphoesterase
MKALVFADLHYFIGEPEKFRFSKTQKLVQYALPILDKIEALVKEDTSIDFAVNLGDLIQDAEDKEMDIRALSYLKGRLDNFRCPVYTVFGNHDLKMLDTIEEAEAILATPAAYSFDIKGCHAVFISPEIRCELGIERGGCYKAQYISKAHIEWLKEDLKRNKLPCIIFTHYALAEDATLYDELNFVKNAKEVKDIIKNDKNVVGVFSGHTHENNRITEDGKEYFIVSSLIGSPTENGIPDGSYFIIDIEDGTLNVTLDAIKVV